MISITVKHKSNIPICQTTRVKNRTIFKIVIHSERLAADMHLVKQITEGAATTLIGTYVADDSRNTCLLI